MKILNPLAVLACAVLILAPAAVASDASLTLTQGDTGKTFDLTFLSVDFGSGIACGQVEALRTEGRAGTKTLDDVDCNAVCSIAGPPSADCLAACYAGDVWDDGGSDGTGGGWESGDTDCGERVIHCVVELSVGGLPTRHKYTVTVDACDPCTLTRKYIGTIENSSCC